MLDRLLASMLKPRGLVSLAASAMAITFMFALLSGVAEQTFPSYGS